MASNFSNTDRAQLAHLVLFPRQEITAVEVAEGAARAALIIFARACGVNESNILDAVENAIQVTRAAITDNKGADHE